MRKTLRKCITMLRKSSNLWTILSMKTILSWSKKEGKCWAKIKMKMVNSLWELRVKAPKTTANLIGVISKSICLRKRVSNPKPIHHPWITSVGESGHTTKLIILNQSWIVLWTKLNCWVRLLRGKRLSMWERQVRIQN